MASAEVLSNTSINRSLLFTFTATVTPAVSNGKLRDDPKYAYAYNL